ncbi:hypothetical protein [Parapedobacter soli]|uniref:hypothetical protein n=1 Tax=Parapedobacter soli TaxID=416955 RepID=UPI0021C7E7BD|nr:hypothetical protein [Parapedobacter soli]
MRHFHYFFRFSFLAVLFMVHQGAIAHDSPHTRKGAGPKYWIAYEQCWITNSPITEDRWQKNIDWMAQTFKAYGFDMICNDGWIEAAQTIDANGYITKYNDDWEHTFSHWSRYVQQKGMKLGVYYNPMWMTKAAYDQNVTVQGTSYKAQDIAGSISFNEPLYWVDTDKPGAKEWIQGYVQHFIDIGATYLRIDFLENYERNYGTTKYRQALAWIKEAAGDQLFLSLVMPNCYHHGETELAYGDMIRIDDDCFDGGWDFVSGRRRGEQRPIWPQYGNAFDGFIGFSDIGGRGQLILDGDFMRMNTMATDEERKFMISLMVIGGSALAIADQYDTIDGHEWVYQNEELLVLNEQGLVCKPLSNDPKDVAASSTWIGQLPNGDWIVGLFNREDTPQLRKVDFARDLGLAAGEVTRIRDLWAHTDLDSAAGGFANTLAPHSCQILRITAVGQRYEAEVASHIGGARKGSTHFGHSGIAYVDILAADDAQTLFAIEVADGGTHTLGLRYGTSTAEAAACMVTVNDGKSHRLALPASLLPGTWQHATHEIMLRPGVNYLSVASTGDRGHTFLLDFIEVDAK